MAGYRIPDINRIFGASLVQKVIMKCKVKILYYNNFTSIDVDTVHNIDLVTVKDIIVLQ